MSLTSVTLVLLFTSSPHIILPPVQSSPRRCCVPSSPPSLPVLLPPPSRCVPRIEREPAGAQPSSSVISRRFFLVSPHFRNSRQHYWRSCLGGSYRVRARTFNFRSSYSSCSSSSRSVFAEIFLINFASRQRRLLSLQRSSGSVTLCKKRRRKVGRGRASKHLIVRRSRESFTLFISYF